MFVINRSYRDVAFPTSIGNVIIKGVKSNTLHLPEQNRYGFTLVDDAIWDEIKLKWGHILAQGFIYADVKEKEIRAKANDVIQEPMKIQPIVAK